MLHHLPSSVQSVDLHTILTVKPNGIIIGGGIVGLTVAIAMQQLGIPVKVYESAPEIRR